MATTIPGQIGKTARLLVTITKIERVKNGNSVSVYYTLTYPGAPTSIRVLQTNESDPSDNLLVDFKGSGTSDDTWDYETYA